MATEDRVLERDADLPSLAPVVARLDAVLAGPRPGARQVARLIASDPALLARILRTVNATSFGFPGRIATATQAVVILGLSAIRTIVLAAPVVDGVGAARRGELDLRACRVHALACGFGARALAQRLGIKAREEIFTAASLHDIGKLALAAELGEAYRYVLCEARDERRPLMDVERDRLGTTHAALGARLLARWHLPQPIVDAARHHHDPELAERPRAAAVIHVADALARAAFPDPGAGGPLSPLCSLAWETFGLAGDDLDRLLDRVAAETAAALAAAGIARRRGGADPSRSRLWQAAIA